MVSWEDLKNAAKDAFVLDHCDASEFSLTVQRRDEGKTRAQRVMVRHYEAWGEEMVEVRSAFGRAEDFAPTDMLEESLRMPLGAIAQHGGFLVVVQKVPLGHTTSSGILAMMEKISLVADVLEARTGSDRF